MWIGTYSVINILYGNRKPNFVSFFYASPITHEDLTFREQGVLTDSQSVRNDLPLSHILGWFVLIKKSVIYLLILPQTKVFSFIYEPSYMNIWNSFPYRKNEFLCFRISFQSLVFWQPLIFSDLWIEGLNYTPVTNLSSVGWHFSIATLLVLLHYVYVILHSKFPDNDVHNLHYTYTHIYIHIYMYIHM